MTALTEPALVVPGVVEPAVDEPAVVEPGRAGPDGPAGGDPRLRISVVVPCKDDAVMLRRCLAALRAQGRRADEVVVVDNGSLDDSAAVARARGARVVVEPEPGIPAASAAGYDAATGDVVARLDADCVPGRDWLARIEARFLADERLTALTGGATFTDGPSHWRVPGARLYLGAYVLTVSSALGHVPLFGSNCAFRRAAWLEVRDEVHRTGTAVHDDIDLSYHLGPTRKIRFDPRLRMGISARPFARDAGLGLRVRRGFRSVVVHWPHDWPWLRVTRRVVAAVRRAQHARGVR